MKVGIAYNFPPLMAANTLTRVVVRGVVKSLINVRRSWTYPLMFLFYALVGTTGVVEILLFRNDDVLVC
jgi:hydrogenase/urease accessory protein HupE